MPKISSTRKQERRQQLLDAGWRCAGRVGYAQMTVDDVCLEAGLSKGAFYGYFKSKQDLLVALLEDDARALDSIFVELNARKLPYVARLRSFAREMCNRGADQSAVQLRSDLWAEIVTEPVVREHLVIAVQRRRTELRRWIEAAVAGGELAPLPANALASILLALGDGLTLHSALDPTAFRWGNIARVLDALFAGISPGPQ